MGKDIRRVTTGHYLRCRFRTFMAVSHLAHAHELTHRFILIDGHIDFPWQLSLNNDTTSGRHLAIAVRGAKGDFDYERARAGGLSAAFMAVYIPASFQGDFTAGKQEAFSLIALIEEIISYHPDKFAPGHSPALIEANFKNGLVSLPIGLENGAPVEHLDDIEAFFQRGVRYITLTHSKDNHICDSSYDVLRTWKGLSPFGRKVIAGMNAAGMMIDVSHISDAAFYQVMDLSATPVIASHSSCRHFTPGWERNMSDDMIRLLAEKGGVIQINFGSDFIHADVARTRKEHKHLLHEFLGRHDLSEDDPEALPYIEEFRRKHPASFADVRDVADHIDHVRNLAGIDCIGLGSDFDGVGDSLPTGLKDVSMYPNLIAELLSRNYSDDDIRKICHANVWRVWNAVLQYAGKS